MSPEQPLRLGEVAEKYRAAGYEVLVQPSDRDLPSSLHGLRPDLLARRGEDNVLVEVKSSARGRELDRYRTLAERVHAEPGWRLDLVVSTPPDQLAGISDYPVLTLVDARARFEDARKLLDGGYPDAALLLAWAGVEGVLRGIAEKEDVALQRQSTGSLLQKLTTTGALSRSDYQQLRDTLAQRSAVAHGFGAAGVDDSARALIELGHRLMADMDRAA
jgi:hypothetical protein